MVAILHCYWSPLTTNQLVEGGGDKEFEVSEDSLRTLKAHHLLP